MIKCGVEYGDEIRIRITSTDSDHIVAEIVYIDPYWRKRYNHLKAGCELYFKRNKYNNWWNIERPIFPWFRLTEDGKFEYWNEKLSH